MIQELWKEALFRAARKKCFYDLRNIDLVAADASFLPFPSSRFDLSVSSLGLNNFENLASVLSLIYLAGLWIDGRSVRS